MRISRSRRIVSGLFLATLSCLGPWPFQALASNEAVAIHYQFAGTASFTGNTNFALSQRLCALPSSLEFRRLALDRLAGVFWRGLNFKAGNDPVAYLRPILDDLLGVESVASFGGASKEHLDFVLAAHLDPARAQAWRQTLASALDGPGEAFQAEGFSGTRWNCGGDDSFWLVQARDWAVAGRGKDLQPVSADYLQQIQKTGRPSPALKEAWIQGNINWPRLATWVSLASSPFKLARTAFQVSAANGRFRVTGTIAYPEAVPWSAAPWRFPKDLVHEPLMSFTAARDLAPLLKPDAPLPRIFPPAFDNQFYCWAERELAFQTYAAWPVPDGADALKKIHQSFLPDLNSLLTQPHDPPVGWAPKTSEIFWPKSSVLVPSISSVHQKEGDYLLAKLFPLSESKRPAPASLWKQFDHADDLVYYDWEFTGPRLQQWRLLCEFLPVLPDAPLVLPAKAKQAPPVVVVDAWLGGLTPFLGNTATEIKRSAPNQLSVTRTTPFVFSSFELLWLSHWLTDTPAGPVNTNLLPIAKITGPGFPSR